MNVIARTCKLENHEHALYITLDDLKDHGKYQVPNKVEEDEEEKESVNE